MSFNAINMSSNAIFYTGNVSEPLVALQDFSDSGSDRSPARKEIVSVGSLCVVYYGYCAGIHHTDEFYCAAYNDIPDSVDEAKKSEQTEDYVWHTFS